MEEYNEKVPERRKRAKTVGMCESSILEEPFPDIGDNIYKCTIVLSAVDDDDYEQETEVHGKDSNVTVTVSKKDKLLKPGYSRLDAYLNSKYSASDTAARVNPILGKNRCWPKQPEVVINPKRADVTIKLKQPEVVVKPVRSGGQLADGMVKLKQPEVVVKPVRSGGQLGEHRVTLAPKASVEDYKRYETNFSNVRNVSVSTNQLLPSQFGKEMEAKESCVKVGKLRKTTIMSKVYSSPSQRDSCDIGTALIKKYVKPDGDTSTVADHALPAQCGMLPVGSIIFDNTHAPNLSERIEGNPATTGTVFRSHFSHTKNISKQEVSIVQEVKPGNDSSMTGDNFPRGQGDRLVIKSLPSEEKLVKAGKTVSLSEKNPVVKEGKTLSSSEKNPGKSPIVSKKPGKTLSVCEKSGKIISVSEQISSCMQSGFGGVESVSCENIVDPIVSNAKVVKKEKECSIGVSEKEHYSSVQSDIYPIDSLCVGCLRDHSKPSSSWQHCSYMICNNAVRQKCSSQCVGKNPVPSSQSHDSKVSDSAALSQDVHLNEKITFPEAEQSCSFENVKKSPLSLDQKHGPVRSYYELKENGQFIKKNVSLNDMQTSPNQSCNGGHFNSQKVSTSTSCQPVQRSEALNTISSTHCKPEGLPCIWGEKYVQNQCTCNVSDGTNVIFHKVSNPSSKLTEDIRESRTAKLPSLIKGFPESDSVPQIIRSYNEMLKEKKGTTRTISETCLGINEATSGKRSDISREINEISGERNMISGERSEISVERNMISGERSEISVERNEPFGKKIETSKERSETSRVRSEVPKEIDKTSREKKETSMDTNKSSLIRNKTSREKTLCMQPSGKSNNYGHASQRKVGSLSEGELQTSKLVHPECISLTEEHSVDVANVAQPVSGHANNVRISIPLTNNERVGSILGNLLNIGMSSDQTPGNDKSASIRKARNVGNLTEERKSSLISSRPSDARHMTPQPSDARHITPQPSDARHIIPQSSDARHMTPQSSDARHMTPQLSDARHMTPQPSDARHITPQPSDARHITPQLSDARHMTPQLSDARHMTPQLSDAKHITPQPSDAKHMTPQYHHEGYIRSPHEAHIRSPHEALIRSPHGDINKQPVATPLTFDTSVFPHNPTTNSTSSHQAAHVADAMISSVIADVNSSHTSISGSNLSALPYGSPQLETALKGPLETETEQLRRKTQCDVKQLDGTYHQGHCNMETIIGSTNKGLSYVPSYAMTLVSRTPELMSNRPVTEFFLNSEESDSACDWESDSSTLSIFNSDGSDTRSINGDIGSSDSECCSSDSDVVFEKFLNSGQVPVGENVKASGIVQAKQDSYLSLFTNSTTLLKNVISRKAEGKEHVKQNPSSMLVKSKKNVLSDKYKNRGLADIASHEACNKWSADSSNCNVIRRKKVKTKSRGCEKEKRKPIDLAKHQDVDTPQQRQDVEHSYGMNSKVPYTCNTECALHNLELKSTKVKSWLKISQKERCKTHISTQTEEGCIIQGKAGKISSSTYEENISCSGSSMDKNRKNKILNFKANQEYLSNSVENHVAKSSNQIQQDSEIALTGKIKENLHYLEKSFKQQTVSETITDRPVSYKTCKEVVKDVPRLSLGKCVGKGNQIAPEGLMYPTDQESLFDAIGLVKGNRQMLKTRRKDVTCLENQQEYCSIITHEDMSLKIKMPWRLICYHAIKFRNIEDSLRSRVCAKLKRLSMHSQGNGRAWLRNRNLFFRESLPLHISHNGNKHSMNIMPCEERPSNIDKQGNNKSNGEDANVYNSNENENMTITGCSSNTVSENGAYTSSNVRKYASPSICNSESEKKKNGAGSQDTEYNATGRDTSVSKDGERETESKTSKECEVKTIVSSSGINEGRVPEILDNSAATNREDDGVNGFPTLAGNKNVQDVLSRIRTDQRAFVGSTDAFDLHVGSNISEMKSNYLDLCTGIVKRKRGRPRKYSEPIIMKNLSANCYDVTKAVSKLSTSAYIKNLRLRKALHCSPAYIEKLCLRKTLHSLKEAVDSSKVMWLHIKEKEMIEMKEKKVLQALCDINTAKRKLHASNQSSKLLDTTSELSNGTNDALDTTAVLSRGTIELSDTTNELSIDANKSSDTTNELCARSEPSSDTTNELYARSEPSSGREISRTSYEDVLPSTSKATSKPNIRGKRRLRRNLEETAYLTIFEGQCKRSILSMAGRRLFDDSGISKKKVRFSDDIVHKDNADTADTFNSSNCRNIESWKEKSKENYSDSSIPNLESESDSDSSLPDVSVKSERVSHSSLLNLSEKSESVSHSSLLNLSENSKNDSHSLLPNFESEYDSDSSLPDLSIDSIIARSKKCSNNRSEESIRKLRNSNVSLTVDDSSKINEDNIYTRNKCESNTIDRNMSVAVDSHSINCEIKSSSFTLNNASVRDIEKAMKQPQPYVLLRRLSDKDIRNIVGHIKEKQDINCFLQSERNKFMGCADMKSRISDDSLTSGTESKLLHASTTDKETSKKYGRKKDTDKCGRKEVTDKYGRKEDMDKYGRKEDTDKCERKEDSDESGRKEDSDECGRKEDTDKCRRKEDTDNCGKEENYKYRSKEDTDKYARKLDNNECGRKVNTDKDARKEDNDKFGRKEDNENQEDTDKCGRKEDNDKFGRKEDNESQEDTDKCGRKEDTDKCGRKEDTDKCGRKEDTNKCGREDTQGNPEENLGSTSKSDTNNVSELIDEKHPRNNVSERDGKVGNTANTKKTDSVAISKCSPVDSGITFLLNSSDNPGHAEFRNCNGEFVIGRSTVSDGNTNIDETLINTADGVHCKLTRNETDEGCQSENTDVSKESLCEKHVKSLAKPEIERTIGSIRNDCTNELPNCNDNLISIGISHAVDYEKYESRNGSDRKYPNERCERSDRNICNTDKVDTCDVSLEVNNSSQVRENVRTTVEIKSSHCNHVNIENAEMNNDTSDVNERTGNVVDVGSNIYRKISSDFVTTFKNSSDTVVSNVKEMRNSKFTFNVTCIKEIEKTMKLSRPYVRLKRLSDKNIVNIVGKKNIADVLSNKKIANVGKKKLKQSINFSSESGAIKSISCTNLNSSIPDDSLNDDTENRSFTTVATNEDNRDRPVKDDVRYTVNGHLGSTDNPEYNNFSGFTNEIHSCIDSSIKDIEVRDSNMKGGEVPYRSIKDVKVCVSRIKDVEVRVNRIKDVEVRDSIQDGEVPDSSINDVEVRNINMKDLEIPYSSVKDVKVCVSRIKDVEVRVSRIKDVEVCDSSIKDREVQDSSVKDVDVQEMHSCDDNSVKDVVVSCDSSMKNGEVVHDSSMKNVEVVHDGSIKHVEIHKDSIKDPKVKNGRVKTVEVHDNSVEDVDVHCISKIKNHNNDMFKSNFINSVVHTDSCYDTVSTSSESGINNSGMAGNDVCRSSSGKVAIDTSSISDTNTVIDGPSRNIASDLDGKLIKKGIIDKNAADSSKSCNNGPSLFNGTSVNRNMDCETRNRDHEIPSIQLTGITIHTNDNKITRKHLTPYVCLRRLKDTNLLHGASIDNTGQDSNCTSENRNGKNCLNFNAKVIDGGSTSTVDKDVSPDNSNNARKEHTQDVLDEQQGSLVDTYENSGKNVDNPRSRHIKSNVSSNSSGFNNSSELTECVSTDSQANDGNIASKYTVNTNVRDGLTSKSSDKCITLYLESLDIATNINSIDLSGHEVSRNSEHVPKNNPLAIVPILSSVIKSDDDEINHRRHKDNFSKPYVRVHRTLDINASNYVCSKCNKIFHKTHKLKTHKSPKCKGNKSSECKGMDSSTYYGCHACTRVLKGRKSRLLEKSSPQTSVKSRCGLTHILMQVSELYDRTKSRKFKEKESTSSKENLRFIRFNKKKLGCTSEGTPHDKMVDLSEDEVTIVISDSPQEGSQPHDTVIDLCGEVVTMVTSDLPQEDMPGVQSSTNVCDINGIDVPDIPVSWSESMEVKPLLSPASKDRPPLPWRVTERPIPGTGENFLDVGAFLEVKEDMSFKDEPEITSATLRESVCLPVGQDIVKYDNDVSADCTYTIPEYQITKGSNVLEDVQMAQQILGNKVLKVTLNRIDASSALLEEKQCSQVDVRLIGNGASRSNVENSENCQVKSNECEKECEPSVLRNNSKKERRLIESSSSNSKVENNENCQVESNEHEKEGEPSVLRNSCKRKKPTKHYFVKVNGQKFYPCGECRRGFQNSGDLMRHRRTHTGERPFKCKLCTKTYRQQSALTMHMVAHRGIKSFVCQICGLALSQKVHLTSHMRIHTGERPFKCEKCGKAFARKDHLNVHSFIHESARPFQCKLCPQAFKNFANLNAHMKYHLNDRRYKCMHCTAAFVLSYDLKRHIKTHLNVKPQICPVCQKYFKLESRFTKHMNIFHPNHKL